MESIPREIKLMEQIAEHLKIWFQEDPGDKNYPSGTVDLKLRNGISLAVELVSFDEVLTWLRVNGHKDIARSLEQERDSFLSHLQAVEQAIKRGDNPPLELIELRSKITGLIGTLEHTAKAFRDNLTPKKPAGTKQVGRSEGENGRRNYIDELVRTVIKQRDILITAINEHPPESSERYEAVQRVSPRYKELPDMWGYAIKQASEIGQLSVLDPLIEDLQKAHKNLIGISGECEKTSGEFGSAIQNHSEATNRLIDYLPAVESASQALLRTSEEQAVTGQRIAPVEEQAKAEKKNKGSVKKALKVIGAIIGFLAALLTCIYLLWWLWTKFSA